MVQCEYCKDEINPEVDSHVIYKKVVYTSIEEFLQRRAVSEIHEYYYCSDEHLLNDLIQDGVEIPEDMIPVREPEPPPFDPTELD